MGHEADQFPYLLPRFRMRSKQNCVGEPSLNVATGKINKEMQKQN